MGSFTKVISFQSKYGLQNHFEFTFFPNYQWNNVLSGVPDLTNEIITEKFHKWGY